VTNVTVFAVATSIIQRWWLWGFQAKKGSESKVIRLSNYKSKGILGLKKNVTKGWFSVFLFIWSKEEKMLIIGDLAKS
jgi:hypothetical protein